MYRSSKKLLSGCLALAFALITAVYPAVAGAATDATSPVSSRIGGVDRYETAAKIAQSDWNQSDYAILSAGANANLVDALTAAPLAKLKNAPILLTEGNALNTFAQKELTRLSVSTVYVTSGNAVIKQAVLDKLTAMGITVKVLGGKDRFETAVNIAKEFPNASEFVIATAWTNADALSVSPIAAAKGMPILLTDAKSIPASVSTYLSKVTAVTKVYVIGGQEVISDTVKLALPKAVRIGGENRYATNLEILKSFAKEIKPGKIFIANGQNAHLVDSLAGSPLAAKTQSPIVLTDSTWPTLTKNYIKQYLLANRVVVLGGEGVVAPALINGITTATVYADASTTQGSSDAAKPQVLTDCLRVTGNNITVKNITTDYSIYIQGDNATLENVTVKGSVFVDPGKTGTANLNKVKADKIVVLSGGQNSIHISQSQSGELVVTSSDDQGTPTTVRVVVENSSQLGGTTVTSYSIIDIQTGAVVGTVNVSNQPGQVPVVELRGTFTEPVVVEGEANVVAAAGAVIPSVVVQTENPNQHVTLQGSFQNVAINSQTQVALGNNTTVANMQANAAVNVVIPPTSTVTTLTSNNTEATVSGGGQANGAATGTTPAPVTGGNTGGTTGGGGVGGAMTQITVTSVSAQATDAVTRTDSSNTFDYTFTGINDSVKLTGLNLQSNVTSPVMVMTSITARGVSWIETNKTIEATVGSTGILTVRDIFGALDNGNDGISLGNLRMVFGTGDVQIRGYLKKSGYANSAEMTVNLTLGSPSGSTTSISNTWMVVDKISDYTTRVTVKAGQGSTTMGAMTGGNFNFAQVVSAIALGQVNYSNGSTAATNLQNKILDSVSGYVFNSIPLSMLVGKNVSFDSGGHTYTVSFRDQT